MKNAVKSNASSYGLIAAAISVGYTLIAYLIDINLMVNIYGDLIRRLAILVVLILAVNYARKELGGFITFRDAFSTFVLSAIIYLLVTTAFNILLFGVIDTGAAEELRRLTIETQVELLENIGASETQIEDQIAALENADPYAVGRQVQGFFWGVVIYAIVGLIVAAIMKKNPSAYYDEEQQGTEV